MTGSTTVLGSARFARHLFNLWRRTWYGSAFSVFIAPVLYLASIGLGLGSLIDSGAQSEALGGVGYAAFAGTGLMAGSAMQSGAGEMAWPVLGALKYTRTWNAAISAPLDPVNLVGGKIIFLAMRLTAAGTVFAAALVLFGLVTPLRALATVPVAVLIGVSIGVCMFALVSVSTKDFTVSATFRFVVNPLFILSGTFFPIGQLPAFAQRLAVASPLWHGVELLRAVALGVPTALPVVVHVAVLLAFGLVGTTASTIFLRRRLQP